MTKKNSIKHRRICSKGHIYYKSSSCPICPVCENYCKSDGEFLAEIAGPARRALERININCLTQLSKMCEPDVLKLHGMGPGTIPKLRSALKLKGLSFNKLIK